MQTVKAELLDHLLLHVTAAVFEETDNFRRLRGSIQLVVAAAGAGSWPGLSATVELLIHPNSVQA